MTSRVYSTPNPLGKIINNNYIANRKLKLYLWFLKYFYLVFAQIDDDFANKIETYFDILNKEDLEL